MDVKKYIAFLKCGKRSLRERGFTLIELLTVTAIIIIITSIVLANNTRFGGSIQLENLAYDIALTIRQAQVYGIATQRFQTNNYSAPYGVHFSTQSSPTATNPSSQVSYVLFGDAVTADGFFDCPGGPGAMNCETVQSSTISGGYKITDLCGTDSTGEHCRLTQLDVVYQRPQPDAYIRSSAMTPNTPIVTEYTQAHIVVTSPRGDTRNICIDFNGQIYVEPLSC